jgi:glutathione S-transferase
MQLIGTYYSPFARRVAAALISRGIPYEHDALNGYTDPVRARSLNPVGKVPVLVIDQGEHLIDSAAILDHINERVGADAALVPHSGPDRRAVLRLSAIAATLCEQCTAASLEGRRVPNEAVIDGYKLSIRGGLGALDAASGPRGLIGGKPLSIATISAIVAFDYASMMLPELQPAGIAPSLAAVAAALADEPAFKRTYPRSA